jgi:hypothetical protein
MKAGRLMIGWHRQWHNPSQAEEAADWLQNEPQIYFEDSDTSWNGQFRKVKITVIVYSDLNYGDVSAKPVEVAEALTKRLVGFNGAVSWEKIPLGYPHRIDGFPLWMGIRKQTCWLVGDGGILTLDESFPHPIPTKHQSPPVMHCWPWCVFVERKI